MFEDSDNNGRQWFFLSELLGFTISPDNDRRLLKKQRLELVTTVTQM